VAPSTEHVVLSQIQSLYELGATGDFSDAQLRDHFLNSHLDNAFSLLVERHGPMVLQVCRKHLDDHNDVEDAFQATFLVLAKRAGSIRNAESLAGWLHGVARRIALRIKADAARREIHERKGGTLAALERASTREQDVHDPNWPELHEEIARLPERFQEPIVLCYLEGLTTEAASVRLRCPKGTVLSRLARARERLRDRLTRRGLALPAGLAAAQVIPEPTSALSATLLARTTQLSTNFVAGKLAGISAQTLRLAQGALFAMTLAQWKTFTIAAVVCLLGMGTLTAIAQSDGGTGPKSRNSPEPSKVSQPSVRDQAIESLQNKLKQATEYSAKLDQELTSIREELQDLRANDARTQRDKNSPNHREVNKPTQSAGGTSEASGGTKPKYSWQQLDTDTLVFTSKESGKLKVINTKTKESFAVQLTNGKNKNLIINYILGVSGCTLSLQGNGITQLAAGDPSGSKWSAIELSEPYDGMILPLFNADPQMRKYQATSNPFRTPDTFVIYQIGQSLYGYSFTAYKWSKIQLDSQIVSSHYRVGIMPGSGDQPRDYQTATVQSRSRLYTFNTQNATWSQLDFDTLINTPE